MINDELLLLRKDYTDMVKVMVMKPLTWVVKPLRVYIVL